MTITLEDRMKHYESTNTQLKRDACVFFRLDGRSFSNFTKNFEKTAQAHSIEFKNLMVDTTQHLLNFFKFDVAYTQSDEITLVYKPIRNELTEPMFGYRRDKLISNICSVCTSYFVSNLPKKFDLLGVYPSFDCRGWSVYDRENDLEYTEAANSVIWRQMDCYRNAVGIIARSFFSSKELMGKNLEQRKVMIKEKGFNLENYDRSILYGTIIKRLTNNNHQKYVFNLSDVCLVERIKILFGEENEGD